MRGGGKQGIWGDGWERWVSVCLRARSARVLWQWEDGRRERQWRLGVLGCRLVSGNTESRESNTGSHRAQTHSVSELEEERGRPGESKRRQGERARSNRQAS